MIPALLLACADPAPLAPDAAQAQAWAGEVVGTTLLVGYTGLEGAAAGATVRFGDEALELLAGADPRGEVEALAVALGLPEQAIVEVQPWVERDGQRRALPTLTVETGAIPAAVPRPTREGSPAATWTYTAHGLATWTPLLLAPDGTPTWWALPGWQDMAVIRARPLPDGSGVRVLRFPVLAAGGAGAVPEGFVDLGWDGVVLRELDEPGAHHDFTFLPDGRTAWLAFDPAEVDGQPVYGDVLRVGEPGGDSAAIWSSWDALEHDPARDEEAAGLRYATLANAVEHDPVHDRLLVGVKNYGAVLAVDPDSGAEAWRLAADGGDLDLAEPGRHPAGQHGIQATADGFMVFDNGRAADGASRAVAYAIDEQARVATQLWEHTTDPPHYALVLGDVRAVDEATTRVAWSAQGILEDVDAQGQVLGRLVVDADAFIGFAHLEPDPPRAVGGGGAP